MGTFPVDNSRLVATATCDTQVLMQYIYNYTTEEDHVAAECGKAAHEALAAWFAGSTVADALERFELKYRPLSEEKVASDDRLDWQNVMDILKAYFESCSVGDFPFTPLVDEIEKPVMVKLDEGIDFYALIDLPAVDKATGARYPVDHKTTGKITTWWSKKFRLSSQLTGYMWAEQMHSGMVVPGAYINAIELGKLPTSKMKCRVHKVPYIECRLQHTNFKLFVTQRTPPLTAQWLKDAKTLANRLKMLSQALPSVEMIQFAQMQGVFNNGCVFCDFKDFCAAGRVPEMAESMYIKKRWAPWDEMERRK